MKFEHEIIIPNEGFQFKLFQFEGKNGNYIREKHWHSSVEIFVVYEGNLTVMVNNDKHLLHSGEFILLNSNEIHSIDSPEPNHTLVIQMPLKVFEKYYTKENFIYFTHSPRNQDSEVMELIDRMYQGVKKKETGYEYAVQSEFFYLLYLLVSKYRKTEISSEIMKYYKKLDRLSEIAAYMKEHYQEEISLEKLSEQFGYSPAYLSRMFRKYAQTNYKIFLQGLRLEYAYQELVNSNHTIAEVALNNGFANTKAFVREFQKKYQVLPSEYRKNRQKSERKR